MFKRYVFLIIAAIVVLVGATSCDKDTYEKTDVKFYKFMDDKTIVVYDEDGIEIGQKSVEIQLHAQLTFPRPDLSTPLAFAEDEPGERLFSLAGEIYDDAKGDYKTAPNSIDFSFSYIPYGEVTVRLTGANVNSDDDVLVCLDPLQLKAEIISLKEISEPFYQKAQVKYKLKTQSTGILVNEIVQEFELGTKPDDEGEGDKTEPEGDGGETGAEGSES